MKYGIISDIHSNLEAILAVIDELKRQGISKIICLGDIVGYGANPNECCDLVRQVSECVVIGNHDACSVGLTPLSYFNKEAAHTCIWTAKVLTHNNLQWLKNLPIVKENENKLLVHSTPSNPSEWEYIITLGDAIMEFKGANFKLCFVGHSHCPVIFRERDGEYTIIQTTKLTLEADSRYIINPGSVGQPRDGDIRASFAIYDSESDEVEIVRISYDIMSAQQKILDAHLPDVLAYRLAVGR